MQVSTTVTPIDESAIHEEDAHGRLGPGVEKLAAAVKRDKENTRSVASTAASLATVCSKPLPEAVPDADAAVVLAGSPVRLRAHDASAAAAAATGAADRSPPLGGARENRRPASASSRTSPPPAQQRSPPQSSATGGGGGGGGGGGRQRGGSAATAAAGVGPVAVGARVKARDSARQPSPAVSRATPAQAVKRCKPENATGIMSRSSAAIVPTEKGQGSAEQPDGAVYTVAAASSSQSGTQHGAGAVAQLHESGAVHSPSEPGEVVPTTHTSHGLACQTLSRIALPAILRTA